MALAPQPLRHPSTRSFPRWSPDGSKILIEQDKHPAIIDRDLREITEFGPKDTWVNYPDWSPNGERVTYSYRGIHGDLEDLHWGIYSAKPDGTDPHLMSATGWRALWSPDGEKVAYHLVKKDSPIRLAVMDKNGDHETVLAQEPNLGNMTWSPDSKTVVYENWDVENGRLFKIDVESGKKALLIEHSNGSDKAAQYSPDGGTVLFERFTNPGRKTEIRKLDLATGVDETFAAINRSCHDAAWSPDGQQVVFTSNTAEDDFNLYLADKDGSHLRQLTDLPGEEYAPSWSPDGKSIAYYHKKPGSVTAVEVIRVPEGGVE